jgi:uncharacterized protein (TIGR02453 family)
MAPDAHFSPKLFRFLKDLKANNSRDWFHQNKARYEQDVKQPLLEFVADFAPLLRRISPVFVADPRPVGGSMFRIHRDTRFSADKSPYKTNAAARFPHAGGANVHTPGFYLHLEPGSVFAGAGIWHPDPASQTRIRQAIVADPKRWKRILAAKGFREHLELSGESLKRPPRGFDPEHPLVEDLKRKDFICVANFSEKQACAPAFLRQYTEVCRASAPFVRFLTEALGFEWS